jgi:hypothetical protein
MSEEAPKKTYDLRLKDGREITFDLDQLSVKEWRELVGGEERLPLDEQDELLARTIGWEPDELKGLGLWQYKRLTKAFWDKAISPADADPN